MKTHWKKFFNPEYLGAYSIPEGGSLILTIRQAKQEKVKGSDGKDSDCLVIYFAEPKTKPMVVNVTNSKTISKLAKSSFIEDWEGVRIEVQVEKVKAFGDLVEGLRVNKMSPPEKIKTKLDPTNVNWGKAVEALSSGKVTLDFVKANYEITEEHLQKLQDDSI